MENITNGRNPEIVLSIKPFSALHNLYIRAAKSDNDIIASTYAASASVKIYHWGYSVDLKVNVYDLNDDLISTYWVDAVGIDDECSEHVMISDVYMDKGCE